MKRDEEAFIHGNDLIERPRTHIQSNYKQHSDVTHQHQIETTRNIWYMNGRSRGQSYMIIKLGQINQAIKYMREWDLKKWQNKRGGNIDLKLGRYCIGFEFVGFEFDIDLRLGIYLILDWIEIEIVFLFRIGLDLSLYCDWIWIWYWFEVRPSGTLNSKLLTWLNYHEIRRHLNGAHTDTARP